ncbi:energy-coupling factor ABC transporter permease [Rhizohabitans arisaemae]|uniref:energy-coupling factor ABC transporter permease n=1 Tax=Rhizohabitans arisaemae TaxID=2720610 RepID=UPI0024B17030|nr:energy-coupling factor ABC transporter permease [Rhizohabitans arisaemae]
MHVPDGFFTVPVSVSAAAVAVAGVTVCLRGARKELDDRTAPMAGLVAAFVFAVQMLNFPVAVGTSGHLLGGALAAILVGPYTGVLCIAVVLLVQALFFADGGLTALGVNIGLLGIVTVLVGYGVFRLVTRFAPRSRAAIGIGSFTAALISVPVSALVFTLLYAVGGTSSIEIGTVATAMVGVHTLIGIGEGLITMVAVSTVLAVRPDLVYGARALARPLLLRRADGSPIPADAERAEPRRRTRPVLIGGVVITLLLAGVVGFYASSSPDGLERVAADTGFDTQAKPHDLADSPLGDYGVKGVENERISVGLAGVIGVTITLLAGGGVAWAARRRTEHRRRAGRSAADA